MSNQLYSDNHSHAFNKLVNSKLRGITPELLNIGACIHSYHVDIVQESTKALCMLNRIGVDGFIQLMPKFCKRDPAHCRNSAPPG